MASISPLITDEQIAQYHEDGFLVIEDLINEELVNRLNERFEPLFSGEFETGSYPDSWHWNPHSGLTNSTRQITGSVWKSDLTLASVILSEKIGQISSILGGWKGARLLGDGLWVKPYGASETPMHRDIMTSYFVPEELIGYWIVLSDGMASTIEYVKSSHRWMRSETESNSQVGDESLFEAAKVAGVEHPEMLRIELKPGSCVLHNGNIWHKAGNNVMPGTIRRSLTIDHIPAESRFQSAGEESYVPGGYNAGRYKRYGDDSMDESFFPIVWQQDGYRTPFIASYCEDALAQNPPLVRGEANAR